MNKNAESLCLKLLARPAILRTFLYVLCSDVLREPYACTRVVSLRHRHFTTQGRAIASDHPPTDIVNPTGVLNLIERP